MFDNFFALFSEKLFMRTADRLVSDGYLKAGYRSVNIDVSMLHRLLRRHFFHLTANVRVLSLSYTNSMSLCVTWSTVTCYVLTIVCQL